MLLRQNPTAGRAFCTALCQGTPVEQVADLVAALRDHLLSSAPKQGPARAEAGSHKGSKRRRGRKQARAAAGSPGEAEEDSPEVRIQHIPLWRQILGSIKVLQTQATLSVACEG